jgi:hypothetical protein
VISYCAWDFTVELLEHGHPVVLLGNIPVGIVQEGGMSHDLLFVIAEGNSKICLFSVEMIKIAHMNKDDKSEIRTGHFLIPQIWSVTNTAVV